MEESRKRRTEAAKRRQKIADEEGLKDLFKPDNLPEAKPTEPPSKIAEVGARIAFKKGLGKMSTNTPRKTPSDTNKRRAEKPVSVNTTPVRKNVSQVLTSKENSNNKEHTPKRPRGDAGAAQGTGRGSASARKEKQGRAESKNTRTPVATPRPTEKPTTTKTATDKAEGLAMVTNSMTCELSTTRRWESEIRRQRMRGPLPTYRCRDVALPSGPSLLHNDATLQV